ncbi:MAG: YlxR family protein [Geodermatophilaceae bacterium]|nr:YlxR family protein [Geodermatophilaceae bacterium]
MADRVVPVRTCVGCRQRSSISELLRVVAVDGQVIPDPQRRHAGRGASLHPRPACLARAERQGAFGRVLRVPGILSTEVLNKYLAEELGLPYLHDQHQP